MLHFFKTIEKKKNIWEILKYIIYYIDDGYSGTTFNRLDFPRLINNITENKVNSIIVKDLSRWGRNYLDVGSYLEKFFPIHNVRFIAVNDNIDSYKDPESLDGVIVPFKNLMNEQYAKDISNKVRSVLDIKKELIEFWKINHIQGI